MTYTEAARTYADKTIKIMGTYTWTALVIAFDAGQQAQIKASSNEYERGLSMGYQNGCEDAAQGWNYRL